MKMTSIVAMVALLATTLLMVVRAEEKPAQPQRIELSDKERNELATLNISLSTLMQQQVRAQIAFEAFKRSADEARSALEEKAKEIQKAHGCQGCQFDGFTLVRPAPPPEEKKEKK